MPECENPAYIYFMFSHLTRTVISVLFWFLVANGFCQRIGVLGGVMLGQGGDIDHYGRFVGFSSPEAEQISVGWSFGVWYAAKDSGIHFRLEAAWDHHAWKQQFVSDVASNIGPWWGYSIRQGEMTKTFGILRFSPQLTFPIRKTPVELFVAAEIGIVVSVRTDEVTVESNGGFDHHAGQDQHYTKVPEYLSYSDPRHADQYQFGVGGGVRANISGHLSLNVTVIQNLQDLSPLHAPRNGYPVYFRAAVAYRFLPWRR